MNVESDQLKPQHAAMTDDLNILNLKPSVAPSPQNEPYKLTFIVENETNDDVKHMELQLTDFTSSHDKQAYNNFYNDVLESYETPLLENARLSNVHSTHDSYCILSAFLYFITITTFAYLVILWIRQKMHVQMEQMHWW